MTAASEADDTFGAPFEPVEFTFPLRTTTGLNVREHWRARAVRVRGEREATAFAWSRAHCMTTGPLRRALAVGVRALVTLTRIAPRKCDPGDNLSGGLKAVRDQIASLLGVDDSSEQITWRCEQERGGKGEYAVRVRIEPLRCCVLCGQPVSTKQGKEAA